MGLVVLLLGFGDHKSIEDWNAAVHNNNFITYVTVIRILLFSMQPATTHYMYITPLRLFPFPALDPR